MKLNYKYLNSALVIFFPLLLCMCSHKFYYESAKVNFIQKEGDGIIKLRSNGIGKKILDAHVNAEENAFRILLFRGIAGTEMNLPLVEVKSGTYGQDSPFFKNFFSQRMYSTFIMYSSDGYNIKKIERKITADFDIKINLNSLRRYLEDNNIIRKFGY